METRHSPTPHTRQVDAGLDTIQRARQLALTQPTSVEKYLALAQLAAAEASWWEALSERCRVRAYWRAALTAREHAQHAARHWQRRAEQQHASEVALAPTSMGAVA